MGLKEALLFAGIVACAYTAKLVDTNIKLNNSPGLNDIREYFGEVTKAGPDEVIAKEYDGNTRTVFNFGGDLDFVLQERDSFLHLSHADPFIPLGWNTDRKYSGKYEEKTEYTPGLCGVLTLNAFAKPYHPSIN